MAEALADLAPAKVDRDETPVLYRSCPDDQASIQAAWASFEAAVGLQGRKFYGIFDPVAREYRVCVERRRDDDPVALGAAEGTIPGGRYLLVRLRGEPPQVYSLIAPTFHRMAESADVDPARPFVERYRRRDVIELLLPLGASQRSV